MDIKQIQAAITEMHSLNLHGNNYTQVQQRLEAFRKHAGTTYTLDSEILINDGETILIKASIGDKEGRVIATGLAEELRGSSNVNKTSAIENCETSAWGRALANLGLHGGKMASVEEITIAQNKDKQIDAEAVAQAQAEKAHDEAVRAEGNVEPTPDDPMPFPLPNNNTNSGDQWQQLADQLKSEIEKCTATWQIKNLAAEKADDIEALNKNRSDLGADLKAYSAVRWTQLNN